MVDEFKEILSWLIKLGIKDKIQLASKIIIIPSFLAVVTASIIMGVTLLIFSPG
jgi:hypothetical protein